MSIINTIKNNPRKIIIFILVVLIAIGAVVIYKLLKGEEIPAPITQTPIQTEEKKIVDLKVLSIHPQQGDVQLANTRNSITVKFNEDVDTSSVIIQSSPSIKFKVFNHPDLNFYGSIIIQPLTPWTEGVAYKIKILKGVRSAYDESELKEDINIEYKILPIELPNYDRPA